MLSLDEENAMIVIRSTFQATSNVSFKPFNIIKRVPAIIEIQCQTKTVANLAMLFLFSIWIIRLKSENSYIHAVS